MTSLSPIYFDVIIIGAGAAGMMCGIHAARRGRKVLLIDHSAKIGRKILISGGGRCNFTNIYTNPEKFVSKNPHFCKSALSQYQPDDFIAMVKQHRIPFHEKKLGQLFCDESANNIVEMLLSECKKAGARFELSCQINSITKDNEYHVDTSSGLFLSESIVVATGGLSVPQTGATGFGYKIAEQFGLKIEKTTPALDGFVFNAEDLKNYAQLSGVSIDTIAKCNGAEFRENILFTHTGLSGPASLQTSLYWSQSDFLEIDLLPEVDAYNWLCDKKNQNSKVAIQNVLAEVLPKRFADRFSEIYLRLIPIGELSEQQLKQFSEQLSKWKFRPNSTVGYKKAEVTKGGVDTQELSSKTMESKKIPGLYFIGEVVDVTGWLGGYNFQWAWSSGFAAGQYV